MGCCFGVAAVEAIEEHAKKEGTLIIDARPAKSFDKNHVEGAVNIPIGGRDGREGPVRWSQMMGQMMGGTEAPLLNRSWGQRCNRLPKSHRRALVTE